MRKNVSYAVIGVCVSCLPAKVSNADTIAATPTWYSTMASPPPFLSDADLQTGAFAKKRDVKKEVAVAKAAKPTKAHTQLARAGDAQKMTGLTGVAAGNAPAPVYLNPNSFVTETPAATVSATPGNYVPYTVPSYVETGINYASVSNNQGNWFGQFIGGQYQYDPWNRFNAQLQHADEFHDSGVSGGVGLMHIFNEDWYTNIGGSVGSDANFLTRYRADADIDRKWLEGRNLITTVGISWDQAQQTYSDKALILAAAYYFPSPWIVQGGIRINDSTPGDVIAPSAFAAVTYGFQKKYFLTAKYGIAREAYQILETGNIDSSFTSHTIDGNWRQWVGQDWGFNLGSEYYTNPYYDRIGGTISVFKEF